MSAISLFDIFEHRGSQAWLYVYIKQHISKALVDVYYRICRQFPAFNRVFITNFFAIFSVNTD